MTRQEIITRLLPYHKLVEPFDYNLAVEWALNLLEAGSTDADVLMLASFEREPNRFEIIPYLNRVITEAEPSPENTDKAVSLIAALYCNELLKGNSIVSNLGKLNALHLTSSYADLTTFYLLFYAWEDFFHCGETLSYYFDTTPERIEDDIKQEAQKFIDALSQNRIPTAPDGTKPETLNPKPLNHIAKLGNRVGSLLKRFLQYFSTKH